MSGQDNTHYFVNWAKERLDEMDATLTSLEGKEYADWVAKEEARHVQLMKNAGFMAGK